ncbi:MAG: peroxiredoxin [Candidatus Heimdallarchaeota archaeon]|nr:MAG: peroxiredoxin [Candidatus Heimdallarchaeota archaeon]
MPLEIGDKAPEFETTTESEEPVSSELLEGKKYVLYFYPRDNTPGCTKEACSIRDNYQTFLDQDILVYGASGGNAQSHQKFINKYNLPFPLLMDEKLELAKKFGAYKRGNRVARITYLIDEEGNIEGIFGVEGHEKVKTSQHAEQIIQFWKL